MGEITCPAPAKINLGLSIIRKLASGYHEVKFIFQQVSLFDRIHLKEIETDEIKVICHNKNVPLGQVNTVHQAGMLLKKMMGIKKGVEIKIDKKIPVAGGLGGGSSDAAQTLIGLNKLWSLGLNMVDLVKLGLKIGTDVVYQLIGGTKLAFHLGEKLKNLPPVPKMYLVLTNPGKPVPTQWAYTHVDYSQIGKKQLKELIAAIKEGNLKKIGQNLHNDFEFWVPNFFPVILKIKKRMLENGALGAIMSGSGPTVFGVFENKPAALKGYQVLKRDFPKTYLVQNLP